jgi:hypothetical protein
MEQTCAKSSVYLHSPKSMYAILNHYVLFRYSRSSASSLLSVSTMALRKHPFQLDSLPVTARRKKDGCSDGCSARKCSIWVCSCPLTMLTLRQGIGLWYGHNGGSFEVLTVFVMSSLQVAGEDLHFMVLDLDGIFC